MAGLKVRSFLLFLILATVTPLFACSLPLDPKMEIFMWDPAANGGSGGHPRPCAYKVGGKKPVYVIEEDTPIGFRALWNCGNQTFIRLSDSVTIDLTREMANQTIDWWDVQNNGYLLPLASQYGWILLRNGLNYNFGPQTNYPWEPQYLLSAGNSDPNDPVHDSAFFITELQGGGYSTSQVSRWSNANSVWTTPSAVSMTYAQASDTSAGLPGEPELQTFIDVGGSFINVMRTRAAFYNILTDQDPADGPNSLKTDSAGYPIMPVSGAYTSSGMPTTMSGSPTVGTTVFYVNASLADGFAFDSRATWACKDVGIQWDLDASKTGYCGTDTEERIADDPQAGTDRAVKNSVFHTPSDPVYYRVEVSVLILMVLRDARWSWEEGTKQWDGSDWIWQGTPRRCGAAIQGVRCSTVTQESKRGICFVRVKDRTPPRFFLADTSGSGEFKQVPDPLHAFTGDLIAEHPDSPDYIEIKMYDNNPYNPYWFQRGGLPQDEDPAADFDPAVIDEPTRYDPESNLRMQVYYTTELYDYWRRDSPFPGETREDASSTDDDLADDRFISGNSYDMNFWRPKLIWCKAALMPDSWDMLSPQAALDTDFTVQAPDDAIVASFGTYAWDGTELEWGTDIVPRDDVDDDTRVANSDAGDDAAFSTITWQIPVSCFREAMPLHLSRTSARWRDYMLRWFATFTDPSGNSVLKKTGTNPVGIFDSVQDSAVSGADEDEIIDTTGSDGVAEDDKAATVPGATSDSPHSVPGDASSEAGRPIQFDQFADVAELDHDGLQGAPRNEHWFCNPDSLPPGIQTTAYYGCYGNIIVEDDERPDIYLFVSDQNYHVTYRFGIHEHGDQIRKSLFNADETPVWVKSRCPSTDAEPSDPVNTLRSYDLVYHQASDPSGDYYLPWLDHLHQYFPAEEIVYGLSEGAPNDIPSDSTYNPPTDTYLSFFTDTDTDDYGNDRKLFRLYNPSMMASQRTNHTTENTFGFPGLWVDEDSRLVFKIVAFDNVDSFIADRDAAISNVANDLPVDFDYDGVQKGMLASRFLGTDRKYGLKQLEFEIMDEPTLGDGHDPLTDAEYERDYIFRNPNVVRDASGNTTYTGQECSVTIRTRDLSDINADGLGRTLKVYFFVVDNALSFRQIEENRRRGY